LPAWIRAEWGHVPNFFCFEGLLSFGSIKEGDKDSRDEPKELSIHGRTHLVGNGYATPQT